MEHRNAPRHFDTPTDRLPDNVAMLRAKAVLALESWRCITNREQAAGMLESWKWRSMMTDADVEFVLDCLYPQDNG